MNKNLWQILQPLYQALSAIGQVVIFALWALIIGFKKPIYWQNIWRAWLEIGFYSVPVVAMTCLFAGMVLALQSYSGFSGDIAKQAIPSLVVLAMTRELAPVFAGLMVAGRIGAAIAAEIGTMRVSEQIDAMSSLNVNPVKFIIFPRLIGGILAMPFLLIIGDLMGILGGLLICVLQLNISYDAFLNYGYASLTFNGVALGIVKASVFGFILALMGVYCGFYTKGGAEGVGRATTNAVVIASILILIANFVITLIWFNVS